jgi:hypothetical protein
VKIAARGIRVAKRCAAPGCRRRVERFGIYREWRRDSEYCEAHNWQQAEERVAENLERQNLRSLAYSVWMPAYAWMGVMAAYQQKVEARLHEPGMSSEDRVACEEWLRTHRPATAIAERIVRAYKEEDFELVVALAENPAYELVRSPQNDGMSTNPVANPHELVIRYLKAFRRRDYEEMFSMVDGHDGALMGGLLTCAEPVVSTFREVVGDDFYLKCMDRAAHAKDGSKDIIRGITVHFVNSRGGLDVGRRWTGPDNVSLTAEMVRDANSAIAALLSTLIDMTAKVTERDSDEAFGHFLQLVEQEATR